MYTRITLARLTPALRDFLKAKVDHKTLADVSLQVVDHVASGDEFLVLQPRPVARLEYDEFDDGVFTYLVALKSGRYERNETGREVRVDPADAPFARVHIYPRKYSGPAHASVSVQPEGYALFAPARKLTLPTIAAAVLYQLTHVSGGKCRQEALAYVDRFFGGGAVLVACDALVERGLVKVNKAGVMRPTPEGIEVGGQIPNLSTYRLATHGLGTKTKLYEPLGETVAL